MTLAMAPTSSVSLPETVSILPVPSAAYADEELSAPAIVTDPDAEETVADARPPEPVTTAKQGRVVAKAFPAPPPAPKSDEQVAALSVAEPPKTSLAQSALSLVSLGEPQSPRTEIDRLIEKYAELYDVPVALVRRVVKRESNFRPGATNRGHYGLMQIKPATARSMGYKGTARGLLDAETNLKYSVKYLRGAYLVADGNHDRADRLYQSGYYYHAKRKGLLDETGLGKDRRRRKT
jgi:soluble lytic murein transglycosylase-like protein